VYNAFASNEFLHTRGLPIPGGRDQSGLYPPAPFRCVKALWDDDGN
jgi:hypothetical protein